MRVKDFIIKSKESTDIFCKKWEPDAIDYVKGIVQIVHGMAEHIERYNGFAKVLTDNGYIVYGNDHRGHGKTAKNPEEIGYFADNDGWNIVVEDMYHLTKHIKQEIDSLPIFLFGHSMGSFLSRSYIQKYGDILRGVILSGTGGNLGIMGNIGIMIANREIKKKGRKAKSYKMNKLSFGSYNKNFKPNRTEFDWLSRDTKEVDKYIADPLCGNVFTAGFFFDMLSGLKDINNKDNINKIPKDLSIFLISGDKDPVGKNTKGVLQVYNDFKKAKIKDLKYKFYKGARHEILNEINREEVYEDIISWLEEKLVVAKSSNF